MTTQLDRPLGDPLGEVDTVVEFATPHGARAVLLVDPDQPLVATSLRIATGARDDPAGRSGLAHLLEHLMFAGTRRFDRGGHFEAIQTMGGFVNAKTSADWTKYYHVVTPDLTGTLLELETERFTDSPGRISRPHLDLERDVVLGERHQRVGSVAFGDAPERLVGALFPPGSRYHRLPVGLPADLAAATVDDCQRFHSRHYRAPRVNLAIAGNVDPDRVADRIDTLLGVFPPGSPPPGRTPAAAAEPARQRITVRTTFRPKVLLGLLLPPEGSWDYELARFAAYCLGKGVTSVLSERLVRQGVASDLRVRTMGRALDRSVGIIEIVPATGVPADRAIAVLDRAMGQLLDGALTERDLVRTMAVYRASWLAGDDSLQALSDSLSLAMQLSGTTADYLRHDERVRGLTLDCLRRAVQHWHRPDHRVELVYAP
jgi:predicted Zn-dependent peptidase